MGSIIVFTLGAILIYNLWARLIRHVTKHHHGQRIFLHLLIVGIVSTICIDLFPKCIALIGIAPAAFGHAMNYQILIFNALYIVMSSGLFYLAYKHQFFNKKLFLTRGGFLLIYMIISNGALLLGFSDMVVYFMLVAFGEEYIKYTYGYSLFKTFELHYTDILLFALLSGFAFAFIENGSYGREGIKIAHVSGFLPKLGIFMKTLTQRGIINMTVHALFTAIIGRGTLQVVRSSTTSKATIIIRTMIAGAIGGGLHMAFDVLLTMKFTIIMPIVVLGGYIFIAYIAYKSDTMFRLPPTTPQSSTQPTQTPQQVQQSSTQQI